MLGFVLASLHSARSSLVSVVRAPTESGTYRKPHKNQSPTAAAHCVKKVKKESFVSIRK